MAVRASERTSRCSPLTLSVNFNFLIRGRMLPGGGVGHHFHNTCEEMLFILDGEAEFTIDGRTSLLRGPAGARWGSGARWP